jgi:hypothetical protein
MRRPFFRTLRYFLLLTILSAFISPAAAQGALESAKLDDYTTENGSCRLTDGTQYVGKLRYSFKAVIIWPEGKRRRLVPNDIVSFSIYNRYFISTDWAGHRPSGADSTAFKGIFVQLVDSGRLQLGRVYVSSYSSTSMGPGMAPMSSKSIYTAWVLRKANGAWVEILAPAMGAYSSKKFRKSLIPFFSDRPDLLDSLDREALTYDRLEDAIKAYNAGETIFFLDY